MECAFHVFGGAREYGLTLSVLLSPFLSNHSTHSNNRKTSNHSNSGINNNNTNNDNSDDANSIELQ